MIKIQADCFRIFKIFKVIEEKVGKTIFKKPCEDTT